MLIGNLTVNYVVISYRILQNNHDVLTSNQNDQFYLLCWKSDKFIDVVAIKSLVARDMS